MKGLNQPAFWLSLSGGAALAALVGGLAVGPQFQQWQKQEAALMALHQQADQLPLLRRQLASQQERLERLQRQQDLLLQLIAGSGNLTTFLAEADQVASRTGVQLNLYEPQLPTNPKTAKPSQDPLQVKGLQKRTVLMTARGQFSQLLAFLRAMERLNVLLLQSDLQLAPEEAKTSAKLLLKLNLSLYGREP